MVKWPMVNGTTGKMIVAGTIGTIIVLIIAISVITIAGDPVPESLYSALTLLIGLLIGSRVSPPDVTQQIKESMTPPKPPAGNDTV